MKGCRFIALLGVLLFSLDSHSGSVAGFGGSTEFTQILNNVELIQVAKTELESLKQQIRQYQILMRNMKRLPEDVKRQVERDLRRLAELVTLGRGVSYSSGRIDEAFRESYRDYDYYQSMPASQRTRKTYDRHYRDWTQANHDAVKGALRAANLQADQFTDEAQAMRTIQRQMMGAEGQMQVLQAAGLIAAMQVEQMQKLRQLIATQIQIQSAHIASETSKAALERQEKEDLAQKEWQAVEIKGVDEKGGLTTEERTRGNFNKGN